MTIAFHTRSHGRFIAIQSNLRRNKLHRTNQGFDFLEGSFSNRDNVITPIPFKRERQPQLLKRWFCLENRSIHFYINSAIKLAQTIKWKRNTYPRPPTLSLPQASSQTVVPLQFNHQSNTTSDHFFHPPNEKNLHPSKKWETKYKI